MANERKLNWGRILQDAQDTLDAQNRGEIKSHEYLVSATGREYAKDLETEEWVSTPISGQIKMSDDFGRL